MIKQNLHTHSIYCDGKDTMEEMVQTAIEKGFTILGFSGHGPCKVDEVAMKEEILEQYRNDILAVKEKYKDQIEIFVGIEEDLMGRIPSKEPYDYVIGSKHFVEPQGIVKNVDYSKERATEIVELYGSFLAYAKEYYEDLKTIASMEEVDIVGHIDLLTKFNEDQSFVDFENETYLGYAKDCIDVLVQANKIFEVNTGAISRGYRKTPYPHKTLLAYIHEKGGKIIWNSDCHDRNNLDCFYEESLEMIKECGFETMMVLIKDGFKEVPISEF